MGREFFAERVLHFPPEAPIANHGRPSRRAITGHMLVSGRLAGPSEFGAPGRGSNHMTPLFIRMPVAGRTTLLPNTESSVCVSATMLPSRSIALRWVVLDGAWLSEDSPMVCNRRA